MKTGAPCSVGLMAALVAACATNPDMEDRLPVLTGDQGIAAVSFESTFDISDVQIVATTGAGGSLRIPAVPTGDSVFLFVTPAGKYCMQHYRFKGHDFNAKQLDQCFDVETGKLSYSGTFSPTMSLVDQIIGGNFMNGGMEQHDNPRAFVSALDQQYPHITAAAYPSGSDQSIGEMKVPAKPGASGVCDLMTTEQASELLGKGVDPGTEWGLGNLVSCNYLHSDDVSVHVQFVACGDQDQYLTDRFGKEALDTGGIMHPVQGFPGKAGVANKDHNYELNVALPDGLIVLIVDGTKRDDIVPAMIAAMQKILPNIKPMPPKPCA